MVENVDEETRELRTVMDRVHRELDAAEASGDNRLQTKVRAWRLRILGYSIHDIAEELGISVGAAHKYVKWAMENLPSGYESAEDFRRVALPQLEDQYRRLVAMGTDSSHRVALAAKDMQAKLLGAYAPTKVDATVKTQYQIVGVDTEQL